jgi:hypothetical protein
MSSWLCRVFGAVVLFAVGLVGLPFACGVTPPNEEVGKYRQPCFPGDYCDEGLTCVATSLDTDSASIGTDGGQCELIEQDPDSGAENK